MSKRLNLIGKRFGKLTVTEYIGTKNQRNRRSNLYYTVNNETHCLKEWCEILNLNYPKIYNRIRKYGWSIEKALELEKGE